MCKTHTCTEHAPLFPVLTLAGHAGPGRQQRAFGKALGNPCRPQVPRRCLSRSMQTAKCLDKALAIPLPNSHLVDGICLTSDSVRFGWIKNFPVGVIPSRPIELWINYRSNLHRAPALAGMRWRVRTTDAWPLMHACACLHVHAQT
eukprot:360946-Chlamydomonas_euryale.AAC.1